MPLHSSRKNCPCPCGNTCLCHKPDDWNDMKGPMIIAAFLVIVIILAWLSPRPPNPTRYIRVDGQTCIVQYHDAHCSMGGGCSNSYDEAICNQVKK